MGFLVARAGAVGLGRKDKKIILKQAVLRLSLGHPTDYVKKAGDRFSLEGQEEKQSSWELVIGK